MKIHILGIAGSMTTPIALYLKQQGHTISGSDQDKIYPPASDLLKNIPFNQPLPSKIDLCLVGGSYNKFQRTRQEFAFIHKHHYPYISTTHFLANQLNSLNPILIAGTFGKTSISALLAWNLSQAGFQPNYFFGGIALNQFPSLAITGSDWSVIEADESINGLDTQAKFLSYPIKYLILTSAAWEHRDCYRTAKDNFEAFRQLVQRLPADGLLIANKYGKNISDLIKFSPAPVIFYSGSNEEAVATFCQQFKIKFDPNFPGLKRRLELIDRRNNILIFDDFAQSPDRISYTLNLLRNRYPKYNLKVLFEPHASFLRYSIANLGQALESAQEVILGAITYTHDKNHRITLKDYQKEIGPKLIYLPLKTDIINYYRQTLKPGDLLIRFSSAGENLCLNI